MTDTELERRKAICEVAGVAQIDDLSDGFHTFRQLYYQRMMLFAVIVKQNKDKAWKSLRHEDGKLCFGGGWFIVGVDTPEGSYTYHYEDNYFSLFDCKELERSKHWDGHTEKDVTRLLSLSSAQKDVPDMNDGDLINRQAAIDAIEVKEVNEFGNHVEYNVAFNDGLRSAVFTLEELPSAELERKTGKWIPCSERLPDKYGTVLVTFIPSAGTIWTKVIVAHYSDLMGIAKPCFWIGNVGHSDFSNITNQVTAWMPLPEPYREEQK